MNKFTSSLLYDGDTNAVETYNSIVNKFVGGKRINFSLSGSYKYRCLCAAISYNNNGDYINALKKFVNPGISAKYTEEFAKAKISKNKRPRLKILRRPNRHANNVDSNYGLNNDIIDDKTEEEITSMKDNFLRELMSTNPIAMEEQTRGQRDNPIWFKEKRNRLTASNFGRICNMRAKTNTANTVESSPILYGANLSGTVKSIRTSELSNLNASPFQLLMSRALRTTLPINKPTLQRNVKNEMYNSKLVIMYQQEILKSSLGSYVARAQLDEMSKRGNYGKWTQEQLELAIQAVSEKRLGLNAASRQYEVPKATIKRHAHEKNQRNLTEVLPLPQADPCENTKPVRSQDAAVLTITPYKADLESRKRPTPKRIKKKLNFGTDTMINQEEKDGSSKKKEEKGRL
ncbi:homeobox-like domain superfamily [Holotrichia oblita]|uniref:Homeobox-like domain superfamily n=1 Tax=Holotrichia oblita TaxID=644536 RepID=A0ACB9SPP6_HOLOL|nr:homeobox-like domain superfamily [Holotrichia oblita]